MIGDLDELRFEGGYPTAESIRKLYASSTSLQIDERLKL